MICPSMAKTLEADAEFEFWHIITMSCFEDQMNEYGGKIRTISGIW